MIDNRNSFDLPRDRQSANPLSLVWHRLTSGHTFDTWREVGNFPADQGWRVHLCSCGRWWVTA